MVSAPAVNGLACCFRGVQMFQAVHDHLGVGDFLLVVADGELEGVEFAGGQHGGPGVQVDEREDFVLALKEHQMLRIGLLCSHTIPEKAARSLPPAAPSMFPAPPVYRSPVTHSRDKRLTVLIRPRRRNPIWMSGLA